MNENLWFIAGGAFVLASGFLSLARPILKRLGVVDVPNHRSSHTVPVVRGAGMALALTVIVVNIYMLFPGPLSEERQLLIICLLTAAFASIVGAVEDVRGLEAKYRLLSQFAVGIVSSLTLMAFNGAAWWWIAIGAFTIASYINATNFMDGINGISALHGIVVGVVFAILGALSAHDWLLLGGLLIAALFAAFLPWNLMGGNMFLGDAGSYLLGASIAAVAFSALLVGINPVSVGGPLIIYLADVSSTLIRRIRAGEKWTEAHRSHVYQRLTDQSLSHIAVSSIVSFFSLAAGLSGLLAADGGVVESVAAVIVMIVLIALYLLMPALAKRYMKRQTSKVS